MLKITGNRIVEVQSRPTQISSNVNVIGFQLRLWFHQNTMYFCSPAPVTPALNKASLQPLLFRSHLLSSPDLLSPPRWLTDPSGVSAKPWGLCLPCRDAELQKSLEVILLTSLLFLSEWIQMKENVLGGKKARKGVSSRRAEYKEIGWLWTV